MTATLTLVTALCAVVAAAGVAERCYTVKKGHHYATPKNHGFVDQAHRSVYVTFDNNTVAYACDCTAEPYPSCMPSFNKLWGSSRCGYAHPHHQDSDRFVWRRYADKPNKVQIAAYSYDSGRCPYNPPDPNLEQLFDTALSVDTAYLLTMDLELNATHFTLHDEGGAALESKTVLHDNECADYAKGYDLGLYFGGQCRAPSPVTVCYQDEAAAGVVR